VFFPEGNASQGLEELVKAGTLENFTQVESLYYLGDIYLEEEADYRKALQIKRKLMRKYPQNTWFEADYARALVYDGQYEEAEEILGSMQAVFEAIPNALNQHVTSQESRYTTLLMVRIYHYLGRCALEGEQDYQLAQQHFERSLKMASLAGLSEYEYIPNNHFWLAEIHAQRGEKTAAITSLEKVFDCEENEQVLDRAIALLESLE
jgi:tetratricopeptide (TPR) repeat protein